MTYTIKETNLERQHLLAQFLNPMSLKSLQKITLPESAAVLDVGCGLGDTSLMLLQCFPDAYITGIDADKALIEAAITEKKQRHPYQLHFVQGDALRLPFNDASFDFVFCRFVLHHIPDAYAALAEMKRVCKPGGVVFAQEPDISLFQPYPENRAYARCKEYVNALFADAVIGRKLIHYFSRLCMQNIEHAAEIPLVDHASGNKKLFTLTGVALSNNILKNKLLDEKSLNEWITELKKTEDDPEAIVLSFPVISTWGNKEIEYT